MKDEENNSPKDAIINQINKSTILFSDAVEKHVNEKVIGNIWKPNTEQQNRAVFNLFIEMYGDIDMNSVIPNMALDFKKVLLNYPSNRTKRKQYRNLTLSQIIKNKTPKNGSVLHAY